MQIENTTDYSIFKTIEGNRRVNTSHLANLTIAVSKKNMLEANPIIVNEDMYVIDGQHRLEVAKANNLPIYYVVLSQAGIEDVIELNTMTRQWHIGDYIDSNVIRNNKEYIWFKEFMKEYTLSVSNALTLIFGQASPANFQRLKNGKLSFSDAQKKVAKERADVLYDLRPYMTRKGILPRAFVRGVIEIYDMGEGKSLVEKVQKKGKMFYPVADAPGVKRQIQEMLA